MAREISGLGMDLSQLKYEVASELSHFPAVQSETEFQQVVDRFKYEVAAELGIPLSEGYNGELTARDAGRIGGKIGGKIGGHMVRRMIKFAQENMAREGSPLH